MLYAIVQSGGRQLRVECGRVVTIDRLDGAVGDEVVFDQVLFVEKDDGRFLTGSPAMAGARVTGVVEGQSRGPKIRVFRKKRRKAWRRTLGHRTILTRVRITAIDAE